MKVETGTRQNGKRAFFIPRRCFSSNATLCRLYSVSCPNLHSFEFQWLGFQPAQMNPEDGLSSHVGTARRVIAEVLPELIQCCPQLRELTMHYAEAGDKLR